MAAPSGLRVSRWSGVGSISFMAAANWLLRIVPKTAIPMVPPIERKNCKPAVTSPRRWLGY